MEFVHLKGKRQTSAVMASYLPECKEDISSAQRNPTRRKVNRPVRFKRSKLQF